MIEVDRAMMEDYTIELIQMMENAGRNLAHLARVRFLGGDPRDKSVAILAGSGGNGGGALVCARRLRSWGAQVQVAVARPDEKFTPVPAHQLAIVRKMGIPVSLGASLPASLRPDLIIDGVIGYSLSGPPQGSAADLIRWANACDAPILALDVPSGLDSSTGTALDPTIRATATMTLALPKMGLRAPAAKDFVGELYLADISVPPDLYREPKLGIDVGPLFARDEIIRVYT
jgi:NAD(P)H-hydrate epimerase